jgi:hypothetical protein
VIIRTRVNVEAIYAGWIYSLGVRVKELSSEERRQGLLLNLLAVVSLSSIFLAVFISSYFNWAITSIVSYPPQDGWCDTTTTGIGEHCFGDFLAPVSISSEQPWRQGINPKPPHRDEYLQAFLGTFRVLNTSSSFDSLVTCHNFLSFLPFDPPK